MNPVIQGRPLTPENKALFEAIRVAAAEIVRRNQAGTLQLVQSRVVDGILYTPALPTGFLAINPADGDIAFTEGDEPTLVGAMHGISIANALKLRLALESWLM